MNYNPYAPPTPPGPPQPPGSNVDAPTRWTASNALSDALEAFKKNAGPLMGASFIYLLLRAPFGGAPLMLRFAHLTNTPVGTPIRLAALAGAFFVDAFFSIGLVRMSLAAVRGETVVFGDIFGGASRFPDMLLSLFLATGIMLATCCTLGVIPMFLGLCFAPFYIVDQNLGPIAAYEEAWRATKGRRGEVLVYSVFAFLLCLAGLLACGIGFVAGMPAAILGFASIYVSMTGRGGRRDAVPFA